MFFLMILYQFFLKIKTVLKQFGVKVLTKILLKIWNAAAYVQARTWKRIFTCVLIVFL